MLDMVLACQSFVAGNDFGLADVTYIPFVQRLIHVGEGQLATKQENVKCWWEQCLENEAVKRYCLETMPTLEGMKKLVEEVRSK